VYTEGDRRRDPSSERITIEDRESLMILKKKGRPVQPGTLTDSGKFGIDPGNVAQTRRIVLGVGRNDVVL